MNIITPLMPHQDKAVGFVVDTIGRAGCCACFMFKGSGKSLISLSVADRLGAKRILVTSDKINAESTWPDQIDRHTDGWEYVVRPSTKRDWKQVAEAGDRLVVCVNYEYVTNRENLGRLRELGFDLWIGDESSEFKDQRTRKHRALAHLLKHIPFRLMLNGDPATENLEDLFGQFRVLDGGKRLGESFTEFRLRYMQPDRTGYGWVPKRSSLSQVQEYIRDISYWCHYDASIRMPVPHYGYIKVPRTDEQERIDKDLMFTFASSLEGRSIETSYAPVVFQKMVQVSGGVFRFGDVDEESGQDWISVPTNKLPMLRRIVEDNSDAKIVVWHNYKPETERIRDFLKGHKLFLAVPEVGIAEQLRAFRDHEGGAVCLIRCSTCRGINELADAEIAVFYSNPFSYARRAQAEGRSQRVSSTTSDTYIFDIVTEGGADEIVYRQIQDKRSFSLTLPVLRDILNQQRQEGKEV